MEGRGRPGGASGWVRALRCGGPGFAGSDPGRALTHCLAGHAVAASHIKWRKMGTDVSPGPVFLSKKRGGLADVSTGLISSQKKKKKYRKQKNILNRMSFWHFQFAEE